MESKIIRTNGIAMHTVFAGAPDAPPVVLLHGFPEFWYGWRNQIPALAEAGLRVIVPDQRGYNLTDKPERLEAYVIDELMRDVLGLIDALGYAQVKLVGHDWGAMVAWWTALKHPERLEKLAILNVPHPAVFARTLKTKPMQMLRSTYAMFFQLPLIPEALWGLNGYRFAASSMPRTAKPGSFTDEDMAKYREAWGRPGAMTAMLNWYRAHAQKSPAPLPSVRVSVPTLMIWGAQDGFLDRSMAQPSIDLCDHGELVMVDDATHWVQHDKASLVNQKLIAYLCGGEHHVQR